MKKLLAIGEALIDFMPVQSGKSIKQVSEFAPAVGGAPANVCGAYVKLGGEAALITQLGVDPFGSKIIESFEADGIDCSYVKRTKKANTSLAFVALGENGEREFSFYRNPGADMLLEAESIQEAWFEDIFGLHFCSVSLGDFPMKEAHKKAIEYAGKQDRIISFDPNLRFALWESKEQLHAAVTEFLPYADILKVSDEELEFITGETVVEKAIQKLFVGKVKLVLYTKGSDGADAYTKYVKASTDGCKVDVVDTTGAGDGFIGSFLYQLGNMDCTKEQLESLTKEQLEQMLQFSNQYCAISVMKKGAIASYPTIEEMKQYAK